MHLVQEPAFLALKIGFYLLKIFHESMQSDLLRVGLFYSLKLDIS